MTAKKESRPGPSKKVVEKSSASGGASKSAKSVKSSPSTEGADAGLKAMEEVIEKAIPQIEEALKKVAPEKLAAAKKEAEKFLTGDMSWADLTQYTPERRAQMAEMGFNQFQMAQYENSEKIFKGLTIIEPDNFYFHQMLGATFQRKEQQAEAILEYSIAADLNPQDMVSITNRGEIYFKLGIFELANADFDKAIALDTKNEDKWANRARMLREQIRLMKQRGK